MTSVSAGSLQSGSATIVSGIITSSTSTMPSTSISSVPNNIVFHNHQQQKLQQAQLQIIHQQQQHQQSLQQLHHQQQQPQQQQQQHHHINNLQFHHSSTQNLAATQAAVSIQNRQSFIPRVGGNVTAAAATHQHHHLQLSTNPSSGNARSLALNSNNIINNCNNDKLLIASGSNDAISVNHNNQQQSQMHLTNEQNQIQQQHQFQMHVINNSSANLAPGWQRLISNTEVIYVSPSGASLRNHGQIKDYLLSPGTCKCGLPCPLKPEYFFDFNSQVPNVKLQIPLENGIPSRSSLFCLHQKRLIENQQSIKDVKKRKFNDLSVSNIGGKLPSTTTTMATTGTANAAQCNSVAIYSGGNVMQASQQLLTSDGNRMQLLNTNTSQLVTQGISQQKQQLSSNVLYQKSNVQQQQQQQQMESLSVKIDEKQIGNVTISKTPPWRKNSILQQQQSNQIPISSAESTTTIYGTQNTTTNERVPPLPQAHLCQHPTQQIPGQNAAPPWQEQHNAQTRLVKTRTIPSSIATASTSSSSASIIAKKKPNFRDDPTGYLDHQTAILHNSILNVVQSPESDSLSENGDFVTGQVLKSDNEEITISSTKKSLKSSEQQQQQQQQQQANVMQYNQNVYHQSVDSGGTIKVDGTKVVRDNYTSATNRYNATNAQSFPYQTVHHIDNYAASNSTVKLKSHDNVITNVSSSQQQQILVDDNSSNSIHQQYQLDEQHIQANSSGQPTTTSIGGQRVTHFPNGMVQIEQNCDNIMSLKPQQQIQLQHQIQQHNVLFRQNQQQIQKTKTISVQQHDQKLQKVSASQGSPIPSSTTFNRSTSDNRSTPESSRGNKGPPQVGAISTSHESPHPNCPSPAESSSSESPVASQQLTVKTTVHNTIFKGYQRQQNIFATAQTSGRNTITSVTAGKAITATTTSTANNDKPPPNVNTMESPSNDVIPQTQKLNSDSIIPVSGLQLQPIIREPGNQLIMTSTGQIIVMPNQSNKSTNQVIINNPSASNQIQVLNNQQNTVLINQSNTATATPSGVTAVVNNSQQIIGSNVEMLNSHHHHHQQVQSTAATTNIIQNPGSSLVIQNPSIVQTAGGQNIIQSSNSTTNFIVNSSTNNIQPVILNNSNIIQQNPGQNLITAANAANIIQSSAGGTKVISNPNIISNQSNVIGNPQVISNNGGIIGQQTVVLNALPNGSYVIQPNFTTTVDGQMVNHIVNQEGGGQAFIQQQHLQRQQIILTSPDSKRKAKKRKGSSSSSPSTPSSLSPQQSPNIQVSNTIQQASANQQQSTVVQIAASQYPTQGFQLSPGIQGIVVNKSTTQSNSAPQQQIIFQNGQIIQPVNLIGQQLLVPAGLVVAPTETTTLLQIQNVQPCGSTIITPQGMMLRAPSPQNKNFLSPTGSTQQFIVSGNNQMSPIGQIYGAPVGLVVPHSNSSTFMQQNATIVHQQPTPHQQQQQSTVIVSSNSDNSIESHQQSSNHNSGGNQVSISPPDTTTHSPRSPDRPPSERSGGSDMVQCVSSSEPDSVVSPIIADSAQSPSTTDYDRSGNSSYQHSSSTYKSSETKIRRVETPPQFTTSITSDISSQMRPDSHESPTNSPTISATSTTTSILSSNNNSPTNQSNIGSSGLGGVTKIIPSFCIGELVWGAARGHPAWPGKIVNPPDGICTPSDSTWVQWFGCRPNIELVTVNSLKSLSEGLEAHHKAQKDTRKSRKLNSQLERAIQEAMTELDRISQTPSTTSSVTTTITPPKTGRNRGRQTTMNLIHHQRTKPIRIAPAPPSTNTIQHQVQHQHSAIVVQQQQQQHQQRTSATATSIQQQQNK